MKIYCVACGKDVHALFVTGRTVYPHRRDLSPLPFWQCTTCNNFVGCHYKSDNPTKPLGCIPTPELKKARMHIHNLIDIVWKSGLATRSKLYAKLSERLGKDYHTAEIRSIEEARNVYRTALDLLREIDIERKLQHES